MINSEKIILIAAILLSTSAAVAQENYQRQDNSNNYMQGDFIDVELKFEESTFELKDLSFEEDEFTGGAFTPTNVGNYSIRLAESNGNVVKSKNFDKPEDGGLLHFRFEEGFDAENLTIENSEGEDVNSWFIPDKICLGDNLPSYCELNGFGNRIDEVNLSSDKLNWPEECRESHHDKALEPGKIDGNLMRRESSYIPVSVEEGEYITLKLETENDSLFILETHGSVETVTRHSFAYTGRYEARPEEDHGKAFVIRDQAKKDGVICHELRQLQFNSDIVVGSDEDLDRDKQNQSPEKVGEWKAILHVGESEPEWLRDQEGFINSSATLYSDENSKRSRHEGFISSITTLIPDIF
jgi:hypothetical protein